MKGNGIHDDSDLEHILHVSPLPVTPYNVAPPTPFKKKGGTELTPPEKMPALPRPAMARPTMKATELGAAPQMAEPISKSPMETRKTPLTL